MKLMNKDAWVEKLNDLMKVLNTHEKLKITTEINDKKEESAGSFSVIFRVSHKDEKAGKKDTKIALYVFENHQAITTFIINGRNLSLLFENSTMNSPDISLHYLKDILLNEMEWFAKAEEEAKKKKAEAYKKKFQGKRKFDNHNSGKKYGNGGQRKKPYGNNYHSPSYKQHVPGYYQTADANNSSEKISNRHIYGGIRKGE
jgi:hypothetical protein